MSDDICPQILLHFYIFFLAHWIRIFDLRFYPSLCFALTYLFKGKTSHILIQCAIIFILSLSLDFSMFSYIFFSFRLSRCEKIYLPGLQPTVGLRPALARLQRLSKTLPFSIYHVELYTAEKVRKYFCSDEMFLKFQFSIAWRC